MHFRINPLLEKKGNGINVWKSNFLKRHCSSKLYIKHIAQLNDLYKLPITQLNAQFLQMHVYRKQQYREIKNLSSMSLMLNTLNDWMLRIKT